MGLETASFISGLTPAWPLAGDTKSQGDDHLRLIKSVLQGTFPAASKAFYFPSAEVVSSTVTLDIIDQNNTIFVDATAGNVAVNLPSGFTTAEKGWKCDIVLSTGANAAIVSPPSGSIVSSVGSTATVRVGVLFEPATFMWSGAAWICFKPGAAIGATYEFDNALPQGYLELDGSGYSNTAYAELFAYLGSSTLKDKAGRVSYGRDAAQTRLTTAIFGADVTVVGSGGTGAQTRTLTATNLPPQTPAGTNGTVTVQPPAPTPFLAATNGTIGNNLAGGGGNRSPDSSANWTSISSLTGSGPTFTGTPMAGQNSTPLSILPPGLIVRKCIRAC